jgi:hypothetical protein
VTDPLDPDEHLDPAERELGGHLARERALPSSEFRGALGRRLAAEDPGFGPRPEHLRRTVALYLAGGAALAGLGLLQALGVL